MNKEIDPPSIHDAAATADAGSSSAPLSTSRELADKDSVETLRRRQSDISAKPRSQRPRIGMPYLQAQVVHYKPRVSVLDKELTTVSYHGLVNFLLLLLSATLIRLAIENYLKYGILVSIPGTGVSPRDWVATLAGMLAVFLSFFVAFAIEKSAVPAGQPTHTTSASAHTGDGDARALRVGASADDRLTVALHLLNLFFVLVVPSCITYFAIFQPALGTLVMTLACIMFLKLYSLAATNFDLRRAYRLRDKRLNNDPLRFAGFKGGRFVVDNDSDNDHSHNPKLRSKSRQSRDDGSDTDVGSDLADSDRTDGCSTDNLCDTTANASQETASIGAEVTSVEDLVSSVIPISTRKSFSLNARALAGISVGGDDRIDAKADALPHPRLRRRAATSAASILRLVADTSDARAALSAAASSASGEPSAAHVAGASVAPDLSAAKQDGPGNAGDSRRSIHYTVPYPHNVTLRNFGYFWLAPTLCYQPSYPRIAGPISKSFVAKRVSELVIICITMYIIIQQYAVPTLVGSVKAIDTRNGFWLSERVLKLSVISAIIWFLGFYAIFHAGLNALAEVLRFADRAFYLDWWNSVDLAAYWREWNLPIHYFCKRHIMVPLISAPLNLPVGAGIMVTFLFSAIMHELLFGIPTHCLKGYSFVGMMAQIPLIQLTQWLVRWRGPESGLGNAIFWISFCIVGQPLGVVQYYYTWVKNNP
ncbi:hypothetical protein LPJ53_005398 [Coemansia erecta]|uniref:O-acyltransferase n=1 Tax=Coemansia erecta TaxID=147472 RepID=A0A9W7XSJ3_9FUNG|nr:hypothetical protein LPJ53_005398 [Coemansia erecta]